MTQAKPRFSTFAAYLSYSDELEGRFELIDGELFELPPEAEPNTGITVHLLLILVKAGVSPRLIKPYACEVQVPILQKGDAQNRFPDLVVLREEHLQLTQRRLTITLYMPPPQFIAEIVSPGKTNHDRDYVSKQAHYGAIAVPEYWIIDPQSQTVLVLVLEGEGYREVGRFWGNDRIISPLLKDLVLTAARVFQTES
jgi:Uma2 family endonuclease